MVTDMLIHTEEQNTSLYYEFMASEKQKVVCFKLFMSVMMLFKSCSSAGNIEVSQNKTLALNNTAYLTSKRRAFAWKLGGLRNLGGADVNLPDERRRRENF